MCPWPPGLTAKSLSAATERNDVGVSVTAAEGTKSREPRYNYMRKRTSAALWATR